VIEIEPYPERSAIFCPCCGVKNLPSHDEMDKLLDKDELTPDVFTTCPHIQYHGVMDEAAIDKLDLSSRFNDLQNCDGLSMEDLEKGKTTKELEEYRKGFYKFLQNNLDNSFVSFWQHEWGIGGGSDIVTIYSFKEELEKEDAD